MAINTKSLARNQLDKRMLKLAELKSIQRPPRGWVRAIRDAMGMSGAQLCRRLGMTQQGVAELEKSEASGAASIRTMQKAAEALNCTFVYALIPRESLEATVTEQARKLAQKRQEYASHSMILEDQLPSSDERQTALDAAVAELVRDMPRNLWD